jgi:hypothetical protein
MYGVSGPVETFAVALGGIEDLLKLLDASCGTAETEDPFNIGSYNSTISVRIFVLTRIWE